MGAVWLVTGHRIRMACDNRYGWCRLQGHTQGGVGVNLEFNILQKLYYLRKGDW